ncbi:N-acetylmuramidase domain-containing protein [Salinarimonas rosea]|uniref:N-acetylmuramidase domain-containing protein n=1 Tax=Salinarimonas rosea TaxID=552063 RepID=UPI000426FF9C|nr:N-acetylmuramidase family protein [Salinarimonas rosea]
MSLRSISSGSARAGHGAAARVEEPGAPLTPAGFEAARARLGVAPAVLWAVMAVEARACGFLPDRRPVILFERHVFHRRTGGRFDAAHPGISHARPGGYGAAGAAQHARLATALALDRRAALESTSWGLGQVMGFNAAPAGYADVEALVAAMRASEDAQLAAMAAFVVARGLAEPLRAHDWAAFARGYNGPAFARNAYDLRLARARESLAAGPLPDLAVRAAQLRLLYAGLDPGPVDGRMGRRTRAALAAFRMRAGEPEREAAARAFAAADLAALERATRRDAVATVGAIFDDGERAA